MSRTIKGTPAFGPSGQEAPCRELQRHVTPNSRRSDAAYWIRLEQGDDVPEHRHLLRAKRAERLVPDNIALRRLVEHGVRAATYSRKASKSIFIGIDLENCPRRAGRGERRGHDNLLVRTPCHMTRSKGLIPHLGEHSPLVRPAVDGPVAGCLNTMPSRSRCPRATEDQHTRCPSGRGSSARGSSCSPPLRKRPVALAAKNVNWAAAVEVHPVLDVVPMHEAPRREPVGAHAPKKNAAEPKPHVLVNDLLNAGQTRGRRRHQRGNAIVAEHGSERDHDPFEGSEA